jgi:hypothetical protein
VRNPGAFWLQLARTATVGQRNGYRILELWSGINDARPSLSNSVLKRFGARST